MLAFCIAVAAFAGAEAGSCRVVSVGVVVAVDAVSFASRTRCFRTSRNSRDAEASLVTPDSAPRIRQFGYPRISSLITL
eukprot:2430957-Pleurochrysis_carterae.AAC.1